MFVRESKAILFFLGIERKKGSFSLSQSVKYAMWMQETYYLCNNIFSRKRKLFCAFYHFPSLKLYPSTQQNRHQTLSQVYYIAGKVMC